MSANPPAPTPMNIPELSPSLKHIRKFLVQAKQLERVDIVMAYLCRMHAVTEGFKVKERTKTDTMYLIALMDWLENNQIAVAGMSQEERQARAESFALSVFQTGDDVDRAGEADESTAKCFLTAHVLFEVCTMFGPLKPELQQKMKYAAWKAVEIRKALREGRRPVPGDALDMAAANALENDQGEQVPTESLPSSETPAAATASTASSAVAAAKQSPKPSAGGYAAPEAASSLGYSSPPSVPVPPYSALPESSNSREEDLASSLPFPPSPPSAVPKQPTSAASKPVGSQSYSPPSNRPAAQQTASQQSPAAKPAAAYGSAPSSSGRNPQQYDSQAALHVVADPRRLSKHASIAEADKLTRHATSALSFEDIPTAIAKLHEALALLLPYQNAKPDIEEDFE